MSLQTFVTQLSKKFVFERPGQRANFGITKIGQKALDWLDGSWCPAGCPDPREDAEGFADFCRKNGLA
jgi:hypothetical protein